MEFTIRLFPTMPYFLAVGGFGFLAGYFCSYFRNRTAPPTIVYKKTRPPKKHITIDDDMDELTAMFETSQVSERSEEERKRILDVGNNIGREVQFPSSEGGGYLTRVELDRGRMQAKNFRRLTKKEERDIIDVFSHIIGKTYADALTLVQSEKYHLHIIDVNGVSRPPPVVYDATILCVAIEDDKYNAYERKLSENAKVANIICVGGY